jgi:hypothetical protein
VAVGMQQDTVVRAIRAPLHAPDDVMVVPSCESGARLVAHRTETVLVCPQRQQVPATFAGVCHLHAEAFFDVHCPLGGRRGGCALNFDMPLNGPVTCTTEPECLGLPLGTRACPHEGPWASLVRANILLRHPAARLLRGPPCGPGPQTLDDGWIHGGEGDFTHHVAVIMRPSTTPGGELGDAMASRGLLVRLPHLPEMPEDGVHILAGWFDEPLPRLFA